MSVYIFSNPNQQFLDNNGVPLAGGLLYTYAASTSIPQDTWSDAMGSVANSNPIVLDSAGRCTVFLGALPYTMVLKDSSGVVVQNIPFVQSEGAAFVNSIATGNGIGVGVQQPYGSSVLRNLLQFISVFPSILDFGAVGDGVANCASAISSANNASMPVYYPPGTYYINSAVSISHSIIGYGPDKTIFKVGPLGSISVNVANLSWHGIGFQTGTNNKVMITNAKSGFTLDTVAFSVLSGATGTVGVKFDCTSGSVSGCAVTRYGFAGVDTPFSVVGPTGGSTFYAFTGNELGLGLCDTISNSVTACVLFSGDHLIASSNSIAGTWANSGALVGVKTVGLAAGKLQQNRIDVALTGSTTTAISTDTAMDGANYWRLQGNTLSVTGSVGYNQVYLNNKAKARAVGTSQALTATVAAQITMGTVTYNVGGPVDANGVPQGSYSTSTSTFTAANPMLLAIETAFIASNPPAAYSIDLFIKKNGTQYSLSTVTTTGVATFNTIRHRDVVTLATGDTIQIWATSSQTLTASSATTTFTEL